MTKLYYEYDKESTRTFISLNSNEQGIHLRLHIVNYAFFATHEPIDITTDLRSQPILCSTENMSRTSSLPIIYSCIDNKLIEQGHKISAIVIEPKDENGGPIRIFMVGLPIRWKHIAIKGDQPYFKRAAQLSNIEKLLNVEIFLPCIYNNKMTIDDGDIPCINPEEYTIIKANIKNFLNRYIS